MMGLLNYGGVKGGPAPVKPVMTSGAQAPIPKRNPRGDNLKVGGPKAKTKGKKAGNLGKRITVSF